MMYSFGRNVFCSLAIFPWACWCWLLLPEAAPARRVPTATLRWQADAARRIRETILISTFRRRWPLRSSQRSKRSPSLPHSMPRDNAKAPRAVASATTGRRLQRSPESTAMKRSRPSKESARLSTPPATECMLRTHHAAFDYLELTWKNFTRFASFLPIY